jgi:flagellar biosynthetic protein FliR
MSPLIIDAYGFTRVLARVSATVMLMPVFGEAPVPPMVRVGQSLALCAVLRPMVASTLPSPSTSEIATAVLIVKELLIGGAIGWIARTLVLALPMAGQFIAYQIGLSSLLLPDSAIGAQSTVLAAGFNIAIPALVLSRPLFVLPSLALVHSYTTFPPGLSATALNGGQHISAGASLHIIVSCVRQSFAMAVGLAAPFLIIGLILQAGLEFFYRSATKVILFQLFVGIVIFSLFFLVFYAFLY